MDRADAHAPGDAGAAAHLLDLRTALSQAYTAAGRAGPTYAESTITAGTTPIKASHLSELRTFVWNLE